METETAKLGFDVLESRAGTGLVLNSGPEKLKQFFALLSRMGALDAAKMHNIAIFCVRR